MNGTTSIIYSGISHGRTIHLSAIAITNWIKCRLTTYNSSRGTKLELELDTEVNDNEVENTDLIETINSDKMFNGRINPPAFTLKWEKAYPWAYCSPTKSGWLCKTCEEYSNTGDQFWKTVLQKHDAHLGIAFYEHEQSKKHSDAIRDKTEIKTILSKGNSLFQLQKRA